MEDDPPRPPPLPLDATAWEAEAHRVTMDFWLYQRAGGQLPLEKFVALSAAEKAGDSLGRWRVDWDALWTQPTQQEWLIEPIIARGRAHAMYAGAKAGKSYLLLPAAAALATGRPFLRQAAGEPVHVVYIDYEMTEEDIADWLSEFGYGPKDDLSHLHWILLPSIPPLDSPEGAKYVVDYCRTVGAVLCVVDTLARAVEGDENEADTIRAFYRWTGLNLKAAGVAWIRLDHAGKDVTKGARGSSAKNDDVDVVWQNVRKEGGNELTATHRRMSWVPPRVDLELVEVDGIKNWKTTPALWPAGTKEAAELLDKLGVPLDAGVRSAREQIRLAGEKCAQATLAAGLKWRRREGLAIA